VWFCLDLAIISTSYRYRFAPWISWRTLTHYSFARLSLCSLLGLLGCTRRINRLPWGAGDAAELASARSAESRFETRRSAEEG